MATVVPVMTRSRSSSITSESCTAHAFIFSRTTNHWSDTTTKKYPFVGHFPKTTTTTSTLLFASPAKSNRIKIMDSIFSNTRNVINRNHRGGTNVSIESVPQRNNIRQVIQKRGSMFQYMMENRTDFEMAIMSTLAITIPTGVILTLASSVEDAPQLSEETANFIRDMLSLSTGNDVAVNNLAAEGVELLGDSIEQLEAMSLNVIDAAFPTTATDVISIAIGEGIAASMQLIQ